MLSEKQRKAIVGGFIVFIMIFSVFGFVMNYAFSPSEEHQYGNYTFKQTNQGFVTKINGRDYVFFLLPQDVTDYPVEGDLSIFDNEVISVTYDPKSNYAERMAEAQYLLEQGTDRIIERGLTDATGTMLKNVTCENTQNPVILMEEANETLTIIEGNCIKIKFVDEYDLIGQEERIRYEILGIL